MSQEKLIVLFKNNRFPSLNKNVELTDMKSDLSARGYVRDASSSSSGYKTLVSKGEWTPVKILFYKGGLSQGAIFLYKARADAAWRVVHEQFKKVYKSAYNPGAIGFKSTSVQAPAKPHDYSKGRRIVEGEYVYHEAVEEIVRKYKPIKHKPPAVLISSGCWLDKRIKEVYNSKLEKKTSSEENNEPSETQGFNRKREH